MCANIPAKNTKIILKSMNSAPRGTATSTGGFDYYSSG